MKKAIFMVMALLFFYSDSFARRVPQIVSSFRLLEYRVVDDSLIPLEGPIRELSLPVVITDHHRGLLYWLREQGLRDLVIVNIDPHRDYYRDPRIRIFESGARGVDVVHSGNWIEFAKLEGIASDIYWFIPPWFQIDVYDQELAVVVSDFKEID